MTHMKNGWLSPLAHYIIPDDHEDLSDVAMQIVEAGNKDCNNMLPEFLLYSLGYIKFQDDELYYYKNDNETIILTKNQRKWIEKHTGWFSETQLRKLNEMLNIAGLSQSLCKPSN